MENRTDFMVADGNCLENIMKMRLTPKKIFVLEKIFFGKLKCGTLKDITIQLEGVNYGNDTYGFIKDLAKKDIFQANGTISKRNQEFTTYKLNQKLLAEFWKSTLEYKLTKRLIEERYLIGLQTIDDKE